MNNFDIKGNGVSIGGSMRYLISILDPSFKELIELFEENEKAENFEFCKIIKEAIEYKKELNSKIEAVECYWDGINIEDMSNDDLVISFKYLFYKYEKAIIDFRCEEAANIMAKNDYIMLRYKANK